MKQRNKSHTVRPPDFFIVGAARCGTTALFTYLKQHPEIYVSALKEPHFFGSDLTAQPHSIRDRGLYLNLFAGASPQQKTGEGSVWYLISKKAAVEIKSNCPGAKIIIMVRNPVDMMTSLHALYLRTGNEEITDFAAAIAAEADRRQGRRIPAAAYFPEGLLYTRVSQYTANIKRFVDIFGEAVKVIAFDDFIVDTAEVYRQVLEFLHIDTGFQPIWDLRAAKLTMRPAVLKQLRALPPQLLKVMRNRHKKHQGEKQTITRALREQLLERSAEDLRQLGCLLNRDFSHWYSGECYSGKWYSGKDV